MKLSKKTLTALSFTIGACLFVTTALADMALGSGYDRLKGSVKHTAAQMENGMNNFKLEMLYTLKDNDKTLVQSTNFLKVDKVKSVFESSEATQYANGQSSSHYSYSDKKSSIWKNGTEDKYYVTEFPDGSDMGNRGAFMNPFGDKNAPEAEKIFDALMGNLKDYVQVEERAEGGRAYSGSLSEAQVPALVNAVSSFGMKQMVLDRGNVENNMKLPRIESDIFVKKVSGSAVENKEGIVEYVMGDIALAGKDTDGVQHDLTLNVIVKLSDIGSTSVSKPDLSNAKIEKVAAANRAGFDSKYLGNYKNDIIIEKNGEFVKIGERTLEITSVDDKRVAGNYIETVKPGFETEYPNKENFSFEMNLSNDQNSPMSTFTYTNSAGQQRNGQLHPGGFGKLYFDPNIEIMDKNSFRSTAKPYFDGQFSKIFE